MSEANPPANAIPQELAEEINEKFAEAAMGASALPVICNRFTLMPAGPDQAVLAIGGVTIGNTFGAGAPPGGRPVVNVAIALSCLLPRNVAVDLALHLEHVFNISDEDRQAARARYPLLSDSSFKATS